MHVVNIRTLIWLLDRNLKVSYVCASRGVCIWFWAFGCCIYMVYLVYVAIWAYEIGLFNRSVKLLVRIEVILLWFCSCRHLCCQLSCWVSFQNTLHSNSNLLKVYIILLFPFSLIKYIGIRSNLYELCWMCTLFFCLRKQSEVLLSHSVFLA